MKKLFILILINVSFLVHGQTTAFMDLAEKTSVSGAYQFALYSGGAGYRMSLSTLQAPIFDSLLVIRDSLDSYWVLLNTANFVFENGLTETTGTVKLGGVLTEDVEITGNTYDFSIGTAGTNVDDFKVYADNTVWIESPTGTLYLRSGAGGGEVTLSHNVLGKYIKLNSAQMVINDTDDSKGLEYATDYSSNFSARSLVDSGFVASAVSVLETTMNDSLSMIRDSLDNYWILLSAHGDTIGVFRDSIDNYWVLLSAHGDSIGVIRDSLDNYWTLIDAHKDSIAVIRDSIDNYWTLIGDDNFTFENGLYESGGVVKLGDTITENTYVTNAGDTYTYTTRGYGASGSYKLQFFEGEANLATYANTNYTGDWGQFLAQTGAITMIANATYMKSLVITGDTAYFSDTEGEGIYYAGDYSSGAGDRWIPDKHYTDSVNHQLCDTLMFPFGWGDAAQDSGAMVIGCDLGMLDLVQDSIVPDSMRYRLLGTGGDVSFQGFYGEWGTAGTALTSSINVTTAGGWGSSTTFNVTALGPNQGSIWFEISGKSYAGTAIRVLFYYHEKRSAVY